MALNIQFTNFSTGSLNAGIAAGATSITLQAGQGALFPTLTGVQYFYLVIIDAATQLIKEIVKATARTTDTITITRAQEGTTALAWLAGDIVELRPTAASLVAVGTENIPVTTQDWVVKTGAYTAVNGDRIAVDTSAGTVSITLPATPTTGWYVEFTDGGGAFATNALTVLRNGSTIMGDATDMTVSTNNIGFGLTYNGSTWRMY